MSSLLAFLAALWLYAVCAVAVYEAVPVSHEVRAKKGEREEKKGLNR